jgi:hypothetical protein
MNTIHLTVELGPETQAKLDKILEALQGNHPNCHGCVETAVNMTKDLAAAAAAAPVAVNAAPVVQEHPEEVVATVGAPAAAEPVEELPKYTKDDISALVRKLAAPTSAKREQAKAIVKSYGAKVSDIPEDKYAEVMDKLTALDGEG